MPYWRLFYHMVWGTRDRRPLIEESFSEVTLESKGNTMASRP